MSGDNVPEQEEEAAADQLHLQALVYVGVEECEQVGYIGERQHQQRNFQFTKKNPLNHL